MQIATTNLRNILLRGNLFICQQTDRMQSRMQCLSTKQETLGELKDSQVEKLRCFDGLPEIKLKCGTDFRGTYYSSDNSNLPLSNLASQRYDNLSYW